MQHVRQFVAKSIHSIDKQVVSRCTAPARGVAVVKEGAYPFSHSGPWIRASNFNKGFQPPSTAMHSRRTWPVVKTAGVSWRPRQAGQWTRRAWPGLGVLCPKGTWSMIQRDNTLKVRCKQQGIKQERWAILMCVKTRIELQLGIFSHCDEDKLSDLIITRSYRFYG